jgi:hypothetical protein
MIRNPFSIVQARNELEKSKRKLEGDLRCSREAVAELERNKTELAQSLQVGQD